MARPVDDIDIATQLTPDQVTAIAKQAGFAAHPTGIEHGTITVVVNHAPFEVTTLRRDVTTDGRRATVAFTESWEEDAARRDFRMNALYAGADGAVFDPTGGGLDDARAGRVIFVGDPQTRIREDNLRILRFFRFNAWYGRGEPNAAGLAACEASRDGLAQISAERVWKELKKLLSAPRPMDSIAAMLRTRIWERAAPEAKNFVRMLSLIQIEQELMLSADPMTRLAAALDDEDGARALARRLKLSNEERDRLVGALGRDERITSYASMREVRRALYRLGAETFQDRAKLAWASADVSKAASQWQALLALAQTWVRPKLPLSGDDVMAAGAPPGPKVGEVMREVEAWWIDADFPDDRLAIIERLKAVAQGLV
jgi:poly(A) polymerase